MQVNTKQLVIYRKTEDGTWGIARLMSNSNMPDGLAAWLRALSGPDSDRPASGISLLIGPRTRGLNPISEMR